METRESIRMRVANDRGSGFYLDNSREIECEPLTREAYEILRDKIFDDYQGTSTLSSN